MSESLTDSVIDALGDELHAALQARAPVPPLSGRGHALSLPQAYRIQQRMLSHRLAAGQRVVGKKVGATSRAVQTMLGVDQPDFGLLLDGMQHADGATVDMSRLIQPRAEGEIGFILRRALRGPGVTPAQVLDATESVMACLEIVDSRIQDWKIGILDTVADNASCGVFALGAARADPRGLDLRLAGLVLERNGEVVATGAGAAVLGHPSNAVAWLANALGDLGIALEPGEVVLSGSLVPLIPVMRGDEFRVTIGGIGGCALRFG